MQNKNPFLMTVAILLMAAPSFAQTFTNKAALDASSRQFASKERSDIKSLLSIAGTKGWKMIVRTRGSIATLAGIDPFGYPLYVTTGSTIQAAGSAGTTQLWQGGSLGLNLSGSSPNMAGKLGIWDGGNVHLTHVELRNRVLQKDYPDIEEDHATHVCGIMINAGINPLAKGMAYACPQMLAYDYVQHISEMASEGSNLLVSNHSYSSVAGWSFNTDNNIWEFYGKAGDNEDYKFGYYNEEARQWDAIAYNAPYYLIVKAAGNNRSLNGPAVGDPYARPDASGNMVNAGGRPEGIGSNNGYDAIPTYGNAKNILTVGAIQPFMPSYTIPAAVAVADFSSWGPTDDGRIKPDLVADGVNILSSTSRSDNSYDSYSGTSMASPVIAGSVFLLQEYYSQLHGGDFMRAATLKGILIHTALEAGADAGPDYQCGWGVASIQRSAEVIQSGKLHLVYENTLNDKSSFTLPLIASGKGPLVVTLCWTDPEGNVEIADVLNNRSPKLVNDLDLRIKSGPNTYFPWKLNPLAPSAAALTGDNTTDNVEKIEIPDAIPGKEYTLEITHKGQLVNNVQAYSLIISGAGGSKYCVPQPATGARITNVQIGGYSNNISGDCSAYRLFENSTATLESNRDITFNIALGDCGAATAKIVKLFADLNQDGDFEDEGELLKTSNTIAQTFAGSFMITSQVTAGFSTMMRIVVKETEDAAAVTSCDETGNGEVQDYRVVFSAPSTDISVAGLVAPANGSCASFQLVTIRLRNKGTLEQSNIPVTSIVKNGASTVAALSAIYHGTIAPGTEVDFTYPVRINTLRNNSYTITTTAAMEGDQNASNNEQVSSVAISNKGPNPAGLSARICDGAVLLKGIDAAGGQLFWYETAGSDKILASGYNTSTGIITSNKTYYAAINDVAATAGLSDRSVSNSGRYEHINSQLTFTTSSPLTIEAVRLYTGYPGRVKFTLAKVTDATHSTPIASSITDVFATDPTPSPGLQTGFEQEDEGAVFTVGLPVPEPGNYYLNVECMDGATLFSNDNISTNPYPIKIPEVLSITGNNATVAGNPEYYKSVYPGVYEIGIKLYGCASDRIAVLAENCDNEQEVHINIGPNPNGGSFRLDLDLEASSELKVSIFNIAGQQVFTSRYPAYTGNFTKEITTGRLPDGVYVLRIDQHGNTYTKKLIILNK